MVHWCWQQIKGQEFLWWFHVQEIGFEHCCYFEEHNFGREHCCRTNKRPCRPFTSFGRGLNAGCFGCFKEWLMEASVGK